MEDNKDVYPEQVLGSRTIRQGGSEVVQSLIKWKHKSIDDVTWEDNEFLKGQFPEFCLEDKAFLKEVGVDRDLNNEVDSEVGLDVGPKPRVWKVYTRKKTKAANNYDVAEKA
ncbi:hypothetical protein A2U01_0056043 [Trifolium medium]|uniref:Chromo domain-containing protein n=1 Tax=Trifolium medium TaxID=97028 RepID=A0A392RFB2_9FABA|nr:hypothetical protein [Trifolium medium]